MKYYEVLESKRNGNREERIVRDINGFFQHQFRVHPVAEYEPNDGWHTDYISQCCLSITVPYPYSVPSNYYINKKNGGSNNA